MYLFLKVQLFITSLKTQLVFCLCGVEAEPARVSGPSVLAAALSAEGPRPGTCSPPLRL